MTSLALGYPGEDLEHNVMIPPDLPASWSAPAIGASAVRISEIMRGRRGMTSDTALCMARYFNTNARSWMNFRDRHGHEPAKRTRTGALREINPVK